MCGRFTLTSDMDTILYRFSSIATPTISHRPRYNIAPSQPILAVVNHGKQNTIQEFIWGLIPFWSKEPTPGSKIINARSETLTEKPSFKNLVSGNRCLIPANGFFEWKLDGKIKHPYLIRLKSHQLFAFAGLWDVWHSPEGDPIYTCTIVTTEANSAIRSLHNRMPVILTPELEQIWLDPGITDHEVVTSMLKPYPSEELAIYKVSTLINSPRNDSPECIIPIEEDNPSED